MADVIFLVVLVVIVVGGAIAMKRAGWLSGGDDHEMEAARGAARAEGDRQSGIAGPGV